MQLKIFEFDDSGRAKKLNHNIRLCNDQGNIKFPKISIEKENFNQDYELIAISAQSGSLIGGHYIAYIKYNNNWKRYNDSSVTDLGVTNKIHEIIKNDGFDSYLLLYQEVTQQPFNYVDPNKVPNNLEDYLISNK